MNWKSTWIWLTAALVLFAFVWLVERPQREEKLRQAGRAVLPNFDSNSVTTITITPADADEIRAEFTSNHAWQLTRPISYPAQSKPIQALLAALAKLEWQGRIDASELQTQPDAQERYGFAKPQFEILLNSSHGAQTILIGANSALGDEVCLEIVGSPNVYLVDSQFLKLVPADKNLWRDTALLDPDALACDSLEAESPGRGVVAFERDPTNHLWFMSKPVTARADNALVNGLLAALQGLRVKKFISDDPQADLEPYGLQTSPQTPNLALTFWRGANIVAGLQAGVSPSNQPALVYVRRLDPSNVVTVARQALVPWLNSFSNFLDFHLISVSPSNISQIDVQGEDRFSVERQAGGPWLVRPGHGAPFSPDAALMRDWLASFTNIHTEIEKTVATDLSVYGLTNPALRYTLRTEDATSGHSNTVLARIEFGARREGRVFEHRPDETFVNYISAEDFDTLPRAAWQLRDRAIWNFSTNDVISLAIHQHGAERTYLRDPSGGWTFAPGVRGWPLPNWLRLEEGVYRMGQLRAVYWSGMGESRWKELGFAAADFTLSFALSQNGRTQTNTIAFGGQSPYSYHYAAVKRDGQWLIFEFPADLYDNFVARDMSIPAGPGRR